MPYSYQVHMSRYIPTMLAELANFDQQLLSRVDSFVIKSNYNGCLAFSTYLYNITHGKCLAGWLDAIFSIDQECETISLKISEFDTIHFPSVGNDSDDNTWERQLTYFQIKMFKEV